MRRIFTLAAIALAISVTSNAQTTCSTPVSTQCSSNVTQDFNTNNGNFSSTSTPAFTYGSGKFTANPGNGFSGNVVIVSPFYVQTLGGTSTTGANISVGGKTNLQSITVDILNTSGTVVATCSQVASASATYCFTIANPALTSGTAFQYRFTFNLASDNGGRTFTFDDFSINQSSGAALPVNFKTVAVKANGSSNLITWTVADEINVDRYEIERSMDARAFTTVASVKAAGLNTYTGTDVKTTGATTYYRVKSVDIDGKYKYSYVVSIDNNSKAGLRAFPSPALSELTLSHSASEAGSRITIDGVNGQLVRTIAPGTGAVQTKIDVSSLKPGIYMIRFANGNGEVESIKFIKQ